MSGVKRRKHTWVLVGLVLAAMAIAAAVEGLIPGASAAKRIIRGLALAGYQLVFWAILSSAFMPRLVRFFGRPFIQVHHALSLTGFALVTLHPIAVALDSQSAAVFLPRFDSLRVFLQLGGRPAWYLIAIAVAAAFLRQRVGRGWRTVHLLNYLAFALATAHANLLGGNFQSPVVRGASWILAGVVIGVLGWQRLRPGKRHRGGASRELPR